MFAIWLALGLLFASGGALAQVSGQPGPIVQCGAAPGYPVFGVQVMVKTGSGAPVTLSISGDTADFALDRTSPPANIIVGPSGINPANCGTTQTVNVTATQ
jgi:hypothetical protein